MTSPHVATHIHGAAGHITLDRPAARNALDAAMVAAIAAALAAYLADPAIALVVLASASSAFCAGGDVRAVRAAILSGQAHQADEFFAAEYRLNAAIAAASKPVVALVGGICMGGGVGLACHASHRVVTAEASLAMPEMAIGFIPDVGASLLLGRAGPAGLRFALTGARIGPAEAIRLGLADHLVPADALRPLAEALAAGDPGIVAAHATPLPPASAPGASHLAAYTQPDIPAILAALDAEGSAPALQDAATLRALPPLSLAVAHRLLAQNAAATLRRALAREYAAATHAIRQPDFAEGVRTRLIDRADTPRWTPARFADITPSRLAPFFPSSDSPMLSFPPGTPSGAAPEPVR